MPLEKPTAISDRIQSRRRRSAGHVQVVVLCTWRGAAAGRKVDRGPCNDRGVSGQQPLSWPQPSPAALLTQYSRGPAAPLHPVLPASCLDLTAAKNGRYGNGLSLFRPSRSSGRRIAAVTASRPLHTP
ncbi:hypothetical protein E2C01_020087 [Portunus trituberculatus]|uniref:Uncharacterized protein n=1 Tax=Portunus trituberculatus TaxID=210409 RepID=A0A5B7E162_PORTR|nr:hypothetical protein [Portunus trituberculatus]